MIMRKSIALFEIWGSKTSRFEAEVWKVVVVSLVPVTGSNHHQIVSNHARFISNVRYVSAEVH